MTRFRLVAALSAVLTVVGVTSVSSATGAPRAAGASRPAGVADLAAYQASTSAVFLRWRNPNARVRVVARYRRGAQPPVHPWGGLPVRLSSRDAARLQGLAHQTRYSVSVWTRGRNGRYSQPAHARFTPSAFAAQLATVSGTVTDRAGHPLRGAVVVAYSNGPLRQATTDRTGAYTLRASGGPIYLEIDGAQATGGSTDTTGYAGDLIALNAVGGRSYPHRNARLASGSAVRGRAVDSAGRPVAGVEVSASPVAPYAGDASFDSFDDETLTPPTVSAADGTFVVKGMDGTAAVQLCLDPSGSTGPGAATGYTFHCTTRSYAPARGSLRDAGDIALTAARGGAIRGQVRTPSGAPLRDAFVAFGSASYFDFAQAGVDGTFEDNGLTPGRYLLCAQDTDGVQGRTGYTEACATAVVRTGRISRATITVRAGAAVAGTVRGPSGRPVANVDVALDGRFGGVFSETFTDAHGQYVAKGLSAGRYQACFDGLGSTGPAAPTGTLAACSGARAVRPVVGRIQLGHDPTLRAGGAIAGRVLDADGKAPWFSLPVVLKLDSKDGDPTEGDPRPGGRYAVGGLRNGIYRPCAQVFSPDDSTNGSFACGVRNTVRTGRTTRARDIRVPRSTGITVHVTDAAGHPLIGANAVALRSCSGAQCDHLPILGRNAGALPTAGGVTDASGTLHLADIPAGHYSVCVFDYYATTRSGDPATGYDDACSDRGFALHLVLGHTATRTIRVGVAGAITGRVTDKSGHPLRNVVVHVPGSAADDIGYDADSDFAGNDPSDFLRGPQVEALTDVNGRYTLRSVRPGTPVVCADAAHAHGGTNGAGYANGCLPAQRIAAGATTHAPDLALKGAGAISGTVLDRAGHALRGAEVAVLTTKGNLVKVVNASRTGRYRVAGLRPGTYLACFYQPTHQLQCYRNVPWNSKQPPPVAKATRIVVQPDTTTTGIDAHLRTGAPSAAAKARAMFARPAALRRTVRPRVTGVPLVDLPPAARALISYLARSTHRL